MRAVDFACSLLVNVSRIDLSPTDIKVLIALASGLRCAPDIAERLDIRPCVSTNALKSMTQRGLLLHIGRGYYTLTPAGESKVMRLLSPHRNES